MPEARAGAPIHWFPGHMAAAMRKIGDSLQIVDAVVEVLDARLPATSANEDLRTLWARKPSITVLTRSDLADREATAAWLRYFQRKDRNALAIDAKHYGSVARILEPLRRIAGKGSVRILVVGIPNSGKSTVINSLLRRAAAKTEDRAGVTRALQWFRIDPLLELIDTPGILPPKIESPEAEWKLALSGTLPRDRFDPHDVLTSFAAWDAHRPLAQRFPPLEEFAAKRGFLRKGGEIDWHNASTAYLAELGAGTFGRLTLDAPPQG
jgi:ribosome biogenesis GTPase A